MTFKLPKKKRYHINGKGEPGVCVAAVKCRFGGEGDHWPTEHDARQAYEREMAFRPNWAAWAKTNGRPAATVEPLPRTYLSSPNSITLPAGKYFLGDPYETVGMDQEGWNAWVAQVDADMGWEPDVEDYRDHKNAAVGALYNGKPVVALKGGLGDGIYWSLSPTKRVASDVGLIGAVPLDLVTDDMGLILDRSEASSFGIYYEFKEPVEMRRDEAGNILFGDELLFFHSGTLTQGQFDQFVVSEGHWQSGSRSGMKDEHRAFYKKLVEDFHNRTR